AAAALAFGQPLVTRTRLVAAAFVLGGMLVAVALAVGEPWYPGVGLHTICLGIGTAVGAALFALMFPARRLVRKSLGAFWLLGVLAAAAGMILLALICKDNRLLHLLTTHVGAIVPTFAIAVLLFRPREKRSAIVEIPER
ncbi:hypothetical protein K8I61_04165, partial [bacterium]|nr:hypothetical protein [bacterium]